MSRKHRTPLNKVECRKPAPSQIISTQETQTRPRMKWRKYTKPSGHTVAMSQRNRTEQGTNDAVEWVYLLYTRQCRGSNAEPRDHIDSHFSWHSSTFPGFFHIISNSFLNKHPTIRHYTGPVSVNDSVVQTYNKICLVQFCKNLQLLLVNVKNRGRSKAYDI